MLTAYNDMDFPTKNKVLEFSKKKKKFYLFIKKYIPQTTFT